MPESSMNGVRGTTLNAADVTVESASATVPEFWVWDSDPNDEGILFPGDDFKDDIF